MSSCTEPLSPLTVGARTSDRCSAFRSRPPAPSARDPPETCGWSRARPAHRTERTARPHPVVHCYVRPVRSSPPRAPAPVPPRPAHRRLARSRAGSAAAMLKPTSARSDRRRAVKRSSARGKRIGARPGHTFEQSARARLFVVSMRGIQDPRRAHALRASLSAARTAPARPGAQRDRLFGPAQMLATRTSSNQGSTSCPSRVRDAIEAIVRKWQRTAPRRESSRGPICQNQLSPRSAFGDRT